MSKTVVIDHPLIQHKLTIMRNKRTTKKEFSELMEELAMLMAFEATRNLPLEEVEIETPLMRTKSKAIKGRKLVVVPILRAGLGMAEGILRLMPSVRVGHIGLYRDEETLRPVDYYFKVPRDARERDFIVVDPMLATGGSAVAAIDYLKKVGAKNIKFVCLIASPEGAERLEKAHPDVTIYTAAIDLRLNEAGYILPGLGDAGDRLFGTKS
jgi:uracil phosphoribosyltransferase